MIHLHARDADGAHRLDVEAYRAAIAAICNAVGDRLVVQVTSESMGRYGPAEQMAVVLKTNPEAVSLAVRELAPEAKDERPFADFLAGLKRMRVLAAVHSLCARGGRAARRDAEARASSRSTRSPSSSCSDAIRCSGPPRRPTCCRSLRRARRASPTGASAPSGAARRRASRPAR